MKSIYNLIIIALLSLITSCKNEPQKITYINDYNAYLNPKDNEMLQLAKDDYAFWEKKLEKEPNQFPYLAKAATSQSLIFEETGNIEDLIDAGKKLEQVNKAINYSKSGYLRALARNNISQHQFKKALKNLEIAEVIGENLKATQKMLFDVNFELGDYAEAEKYLDKIENYKEFDFLIRLSKWSDHNGDLDAAITYLEKATQMAESTKNKWTIGWAYTNLADFYGHNGQVKESYKYYLKSLKINPNNAYAKKGIAWIVYSHEHNPEEALRILNTVSKTNNSPSYYLLKADITKYMGDVKAVNKNLDQYFAAMNNKDYGDMYNKYNAILYSEDVKKIDSALKIANIEIKNRPTPQSYDLLAWAYYNYGDIKKALQIMEDHVVNKTYEPHILFHLAEVYKANGKIKEANKLKDELQKCIFELGPLVAQKIQKI
jgi:tetratricopeptide (TPR) repeat protein